MREYEKAAREKAVRELRKAVYPGMSFAAGGSVFFRGYVLKPKLRAYLEGTRLIERVGTKSDVERRGVEVPRQRHGPTFNPGNTVFYRVNRTALKN